MTQSSRKRSRFCDDDGCDFMPISKRINKLHIRSGQLNSDEEGLAKDETSNGTDCDISDGSHGSGCKRMPNGGSLNGLEVDDCAQHRHRHHQSLVNGGSISTMSASSSQMYQQDGSDHLMDDGIRCHQLQQPNSSDGGNSSDAVSLPTPHHRQHHIHTGTSDESLESQLQELSRIHQQMQETGHVASYNPGMTETENPFYYQVNEMLYRLHVLRMQRMVKNDG